MAHIRILDEAAADGALASLYQGLVDPESGRVDEILQVHSLSARSLRAHLAVYKVAMVDTVGLPKVDRELVAYVVSRINGCHY